MVLRYLFFTFCLLQLNSTFGQKASKDLDYKVKNLSVPEDKAIIYIMRPSSYGFHMEMLILCDNDLIGSIPANRYLYTIVNPGKHVILSLSDSNFDLDIDVVAGHVYYIRVKISVMDFITKLKLLDEKDGKKVLKKCKFTENNVNDL